VPVISKTHGTGALAGWSVGRSVSSIGSARQSVAAWIADRRGLVASEMQICRQRKRRKLISADDLIHAQPVLHSCQSVIAGYSAAVADAPATLGVLFPRVTVLRDASAAAVVSSLPWLRPIA